MRKRIRDKSRPTKKLTTQQIKLIAMRYAMYGFHCKLVLDEFALFPDCRSDVIAAITNGHVYEIEVKITITDLRNDSKKKRHQAMREKEKYGRLGQLPNYFLYAVPFYMIEAAKEVVKNKYPEAGLMSCIPGEWNATEVAIEPKKLHSYPTEKLRHNELLRGLSLRYMGAFERSVELDRRLKLHEKIRIR